MKPTSWLINSGLIVIAVFILSGLSCKTNARFGLWTIDSLANSNAGITWSPFNWTNEHIGGKNFEKVAMMIPTKIEGLPYPFLFQFDLGANITSLYGNPLRTVLSRHPKFNRIKNEIQFKDLMLSFGDITASTKYCHVMKDYGEQLSHNRLSDTVPILAGTIGADLFQNKILVIDYPNRRFAICNTLPDSLRTNFVEMTLDDDGRVLLPMQLNDKTYNVMFDNGASLFPLITSADKIGLFSTAPASDTISISSWGTRHNVIGRPLKQQFNLAGQTFSDVTIYADYRPKAKTEDYDAITGNALFWDKTVIIDFANERFGVK